MIRRSARLPTPPSLHVPAAGFYFVLPKKIRLWLSRCCSRVANRGKVSPAVANYGLHHYAHGPDTQMFTGEVVKKLGAPSL